MSTVNLLRALEQGGWISGTALAARLEVTRAAVWKQVQALRAQGVEVLSSSRYGYRLPWPIGLLDAARIRAMLGSQWPGQLEVHWQLDSTSSELLRRPQAADTSVVMAETQSAGRGRRGRSWLSPPALNIYLSYLKRFDAGFASLAGLSLVVGVALMRTLGQLGVRGAGLKWPNDVLADGAKLAGVLVELSGEAQGPCVAVIGVGINVRLPPAVAAQAGQPVTDLAHLCGGVAPDRNQLAAGFIRCLGDVLIEFERHGFAHFVDAYAEHDLLAGQPVWLEAAGDRKAATACGIDARGALRVRDAEGERIVDSADVTVRTA